MESFLSRVFKEERIVKDFEERGIESSVTVDSAVLVFYKECEIRPAFFNF